jgi:hypothetical protein
MEEALYNLFKKIKVLYDKRKPLKLKKWKIFVNYAIEG